MTRTKLIQRLVAVGAVALLVAAMGGTWSVASAGPPRPAASTTTGSSGSSGAPHATGSAVVALATHPSDVPDARTPKSSRKQLTGKINLNTATEEQLVLLPSVGPAKAARIVAWRKRNGAFRRTADLRRVKGFGYKTFKRLEPFLDIKGDTTLAAN